VTVTPWNTGTRHRPKESVQGARLRAKEIPRRIMCCCSLRDLAIRAGLDGMDQIRELNCILDEKYWDVVPDDIKVSVVGVTEQTCKPWGTTLRCTGECYLQTSCEAMDISGCVCATSRASNCGEADENRRLFPFSNQEGGRGEVAEVAIACECAVSPGSPCMDDSLRDAFMIEMLELLTENEVFEKD